MLERISWSAYWTVIVIGLLIYYLVLIFLFYRKGIFSKNNLRISGAPRFQEPASKVQPNLFGYTDPATENSSNQDRQQLPADDKVLMPVVHDLVEELKGFIIDISERSYIKDEVIMGIQVIVKNYKKLDGSAYQKSINDFIKNECEDRCSIHLDEEDIKRIWIG